MLHSVFLSQLTKYNYKIKCPVKMFKDLQKFMSKDEYLKNNKKERKKNTDSNPAIGFRRYAICELLGMSVSSVDFESTITGFLT